MLVTYITGNYFSCQQLRLTKRTFEEIRKGGTDTHDLAVAAKAQADAAVASGKDTHNLATAAGQQAQNTKESLARSDEYFKLSQQPYITFGRKDGVLAGIQEPKDPNQPVEIVLYLQNAGRLPARTVCISTDIRLYTPDLKIDSVSGPQSLLIRQRGMNQMAKMRTIDSTCPSIGGDSAYVHIIEKTFPQKILDQFRQAIEVNPNSAALGVAASVQYCDAFGKYSCESVYLDYGRDRIDSFRLRNTSDCSQLYGKVPYIDPRVYSAMATKPLRPCETLREQEENEREAERLSEKEKAAYGVR